MARIQIDPFKSHFVAGIYRFNLDYGMFQAGDPKMPTKLDIEIDNNYDFFRRHLSELLGEHRGEFALLRNRQIVGLFPGPGEAYRTGLAQFPDELFSIQEVEDRPAEIGMCSLAFD